MRCTCVACMRVYRQEKLTLPLTTISSSRCCSTRRMARGRSLRYKNEPYTCQESLFDNLRKPLLGNIPQPFGLLCGAYRSGSSPIMERAVESGSEKKRGNRKKPYLRNVCHPVSIPTSSDDRRLFEGTFLLDCAIDLLTSQKVKNGSNESCVLGVHLCHCNASFSRIVYHLPTLLAQIACAGLQQSAGQSSVK